MSTRYNFFGGLVTDGLVLNLDAAKLQSYPGSGTIWYDLSGNGNNGTLTNGPTYTGVFKDAAFVFDGVDDYVSSNILTLTSFPFTINIFFKTSNTNSTFRDLFSTANSSTINEFINLQLDSNHRLALGVRTISSLNQNTVISSNSYNDGNWHMVTGIAQSYGNITLYINGSPVANSTSTNYSFPSLNNQTIGALRRTSNSNFFPGNIANTQIYSRILNPFEVFQNFNALRGRYGIPDIVTDGLVLNLDAGNPYSYLSGSSGTTWTDVSGQGNNGTLTNGASYANGAIVFDGVDDYVDCGTGVSLNMNNSQFTLLNIIKPAGSGERQLMSKGTYTTGNYQYRLDNTNQLTWWMNGHTPFTDSYSSPLTNGVWYFVGMVYYPNDKIELYVNGSLVKTTSISGTIGSNSQNFQVGAKLGIEEFNGNIALAQVYNRALSQTEITQNFNALRGRYGI